MHDSVFTVNTLAHILKLAILILYDVRCVRGIYSYIIYSDYGIHIVLRFMSYVLS